MFDTQYINIPLIMQLPIPDIPKTYYFVVDFSTMPYLCGG